MSYLHFAGTLISSLFKKPYTTSYPFKPLEYPERMRGKITIEIEKCIFCGTCMRKCPAGAITVDRTNKEWKINPFSCVQCSCCADNCPKKCLHMEQHYTTPAPEKTEEVFDARVPGNTQNSGNSQPAGK